MKLKDLKIGDKFTYDGLAGVFEKKSHEHNGYCLIGLVGKADTLASSCENEVEVEF
jgi:hypothetical protein